MQTVKIKNNDNIEHRWCGLTIQPSAYYTIQGFEKTKWANDPELLTAIENQIAVVNNGESDITDPDNGKAYLQSIISIKMNNSTVSAGLTSLNFTGDVDLTSEYNSGAVNVAVNLNTSSLVHLLFDTSFVENGAAQNRWLDNNCQNVNSNETFFVIPFDCKIVGITFSNACNNVDIDVEIYKSTKNNGVTNKTKILSWEIREKRCGYKNNFETYENLNAGDKIAVYLKDQGTNPHDPIIVIYFQTTSNNKSENAENFSGEF